MRKSFFSALMLFAAASVSCLSAASFATQETSSDLTPEMCACCRPRTGKTFIVVLTGDMKDEKSITRATELLEGMAGVYSVSISESTATIVMMRGKTIDKEAVEKAMKDSGFGVTSCDEKGKEKKPEEKIEPEEKKPEPVKPSN